MTGREGLNTLRWSCRSRRQPLPVKWSISSKGLRSDVRSSKHRSLARADAPRPGTGPREALPGVT
jgi:hypothetical protein